MLTPLVAGLALGLPREPVPFCWRRAGRVLVLKPFVQARAAWLLK